MIGIETLESRRLLTSPLPLYADFNLDGAVDSLDFAIIAGNFAKPADHAHGDANADGTCNTIDFNLLAATFGQRAQAYVNVADFGARPNDGQDDRAAIQQAINSSQAGDTISFGAGEFDVSGTLNLNSDRQYVGNSTTLKWTGGIGCMGIVNHASNVTIKGFVADGAGFKFDTSSSINFTDNTVQNVSFGDTYYSNGLYIAGSMADSNILHNKFLNCGHRGIYLFSLTRTKIEDNLFDNCYQPISGSFYGNSDAVSVSWNTCRGAKRHGIELQNYGTMSNLLIEGNLLEKWGDGRPGWGSHMALSICATNGTNTIIRGNVMIADGAIPTMLAQGVPATYFTAIESMGKGTIIENNYAQGWGWYQLVGINDANWISRNNTWLSANGIAVKPGIGSAAGQEIVPEYQFGGGPLQNIGNYYGLAGDRPRPVAGVRT